MITIVTGTYNRRPYLERMASSVRASIPRGIPYDFVIVDGGSEDGTLEWCKTQADITLIEHGELRGAIKAFTDGGKAAKGEYVILANDDVEFIGDGILRALVHLELNPTCGAVAFADNRPAPGYNDGYKVQTQSAQDPSGTPVSVPYAQVGMFRRWLADTVGWWGADDPIMSKARTYGGDNYLSSRIWEIGYSVDAVRGATVNDLIVKDELRDVNYKHEAQPSPFYERYPYGPRLTPTTTLPNPQDTKLRVLYAPVYEKNNAEQQKNKRGLREALARYFIVYELDYVNDSFDLSEIVATFRPDVLFTQVHGSSGRITPALLAKVRGMSPRMLVLNWNGDVYEDALLGKAAMTYLEHVDLQLVVNANVLEEYEKRGVRAAYWQVAFEPVSEPLPIVPKHDVIFLANNYSKSRTQIGQMLRELPCDVGLYGTGWPNASGQTLYDFTTGAALYRNAKIAIGDNQYNGYGFVSNRMFEALANGAFMLHQRVDGMEHLLGLTDGVHYVAWDTPDDLREKVQYWLNASHQNKREKIAQTGQTFVRTFHSFDARVRELFLEIMPRLNERVTA